MASARTSAGLRTTQQKLEPDSVALKRSATVFYPDMQKQMDKTHRLR
jgi:hypothetical protein